MATDQRPVLHICLTCKVAGPAAPSAPAPAAPASAANDPTGQESAAGTRLHDAVVHRLEAIGGPAPVRVNPVSCMSNCEQGCTAALSAPGKWSYIAGFLRPELADDLLDYAVTYASSKSGVVMPSKRAPSLRNVVVARLPAHPDDLPVQDDLTVQSDSVSTEKAAS